MMLINGYRGNLQDKGSDWDLVIDRNKAIYHSDRQFATPLSDHMHEVDVKGKNTYPKAFRKAQTMRLYLATVE